MKILTVDDFQRVRLPSEVKPRTKLAYQRTGEIITLTPVAPIEARPAKVHIEKRDGYTVMVSDRPFNAEAVKQALADFP